jgi:thioredoxin 1
MKKFSESSGSLDKKLLVLSATWCAPCKTLKPKLDTLNKEFPNVEFLDVDTDVEDDITRKFQPTTLPTVVLVDKNDREIGRIVGVVPMSNYKSLLSME